MNNKIRLELEKLKIEYNHCEKLVWNVLWLMSIFCAFIITAILKDVVNFYNGVFVVCVVGLIVAILMLPIAKRSDDTRRRVSELIKKR